MVDLDFFCCISRFVEGFPPFASTAIHIMVATIHNIISIDYILSVLQSTEILQSHCDSRSAVEL